jgi:PDZ domain-containing secreted protein
MRPGPVLQTAERVTIPARPATINGQLLGTTVTLSEAPLASALAGLAAPHTRLLRRPAVAPRGVDVGEYRRFQERLFDESATTAKAVGLRITVDVSLAVVTVAGRPALGVLVDSVDDAIEHLRR